MFAMFTLAGLAQKARGSRANVTIASRQQAKSN
jgi:hypothetical protein